MVSEISNPVSPESARSSVRATLARRVATIFSVSIATLSLGTAAGFTPASAAVSTTSASGFVVRPCYLSGPQITVTSLRMINGQYRDLIQGSCFTSDAHVSLNTEVRDQRGEPVQNLPQSVVATAGGQFSQALLGPTTPMIGVETVTAYDGGAGNRSSNPLSFDVPLPVFAPAVPL